MTRLLSALLIVFSLLSCNRTVETITFEKIVFHTYPSFWGSTPTFHLQVDKDKNMKIYSEEVFKYPNKIRSWETDTSKMGYFIGKVTDTTFVKLKSELQAIGLDTVKFVSPKYALDSESPVDIIVYYNGKRKCLKSMYPPTYARKLISTLYEICETTDLQKTKEKFIIEKEKTSW
jgi:hypothetical protein